MLTRAVRDRLAQMRADADAQPENPLNTVIQDTVPEPDEEDKYRYLRYHTSNQHGR